MDTKNLITVDIICHGVPSPAVWEKYVRAWEAIKQSKAVSVQFRNKHKGWKEYSFVLSFKNGEEHNIRSADDLYFRGFVGDYFLRPSCYNCYSKGKHHVADITLGDLWGIQHICEQMDDNRGTSLVLVNTAKGETFFRAIESKVKCQQVDFAEAIRHNPSYQYSSAHMARRVCFMKGIHKKPIISLLNNYCGNQLVFRIKRKLTVFIAELLFKKRY